MKPIRDNVLVKPFNSENVSAGGILVPDSYKKISNKVKVVSVGNGTENNPMRLKGGQIGYRVKDWGQEIFIDGELHFLMNQNAIIAIE